MATECDSDGKVKTVVVKKISRIPVSRDNKCGKKETLMIECPSCGINLVLQE